MRIFAAALLAALALAPSGSVRLQPDLRSTSIDDARRLFAAPPDDSRIMMRWWWFGPSATREELDAEMRRMKDGGIGGFEVAVVYPLAIDDAKTGFRNYSYLSTEFLDRIAFTSRRARELGLRMDLTIGSGWSFGGPHITPGSRREPPAVGTAGDRRGCHEHRASGALRSRRARRRVHRAGLDAGGRRGGVPAAADSRTGPDTAAAGSGAARRAVVLCGPDRTGRQARGSRRRRLRARSLQPRGDCHTSARSGGQAAERRCAGLDRLRVLRQPRGLRRGLDRRTLPGVPAAPRLRSASAAAARRARQRRACRRGAARLRPHLDRAVRGALPRAGARVGREEPRAVPDSELRPAAGAAGELPRRGRVRRRRVRVALAVGDALGLVGLAPLRQTGHLVRDLDLAAFAGVPRDAARSQGRGRSAFPLGHQSADRTRLAVLARRRRARRAGCSTPPASTRTRTRGGR